MPIFDLSPLNIALLAFNLLLLFWILLHQLSLSRIKKNQKLLFGGKNAQSLEEVVLANQKSAQRMDQAIKELFRISSANHALAEKGLHRVGVIRFNPFRDIGGDQSFSVALLDANDDGVVISSLYSREGVRVYAKALQKAVSEKYPLTEEEKRAIAIASIDKNNVLQKKPASRG